MITSNLSNLCIFLNPSFYNNQNDDNNDFSIVIKNCTINAINITLKVLHIDNRKCI